MNETEQKVLVVSNEAIITLARAVVGSGCVIAYVLSFQMPHTLLWHAGNGGLLGAALVNLIYVAWKSS